MTEELTSSDLSSVQAVLSHWFDGDQHVNYKTKWFPEGSTGLQAIADNEINSKFGEIFELALDKRLHHWQQSTKSCVALILVLDQFSRHICRLHGKTTTAMETKQKLADQLALEIAHKLHASEEITLGLSIPEFVFSLMPLRHTATVGHLSHVLECLSKKERVEEKSMELLNRFRKQTTRRLQHLQDREKLEATADILERDAFVADETGIMNHPLVRTTEAFLVTHLNISTSSGTSSGKGSTSGKGKGGKGVNTNASTGSGTGSVSNSTSGGNTTSTANVEPNIVLFISLSGGVDSMVISKILRLLQIHRPHLRIKSVQAMHIDYGNRPESAEEAAYVVDWCTDAASTSTTTNTTGTTTSSSTSTSAMLGGVQCKVRRVGEVTRGVTSRDEYEKVARDIRYAFYRQCRADVSSGSSDSTSTTTNTSTTPTATTAASTTAVPEVVLSGVIFGHHLGDVQENVISNVMRGSGPLQLSGMSEVSVTNGVAVWRPLLSHTKDQIYDFAHRYGVPYFKDSTPSWSTRGKLRNQLVPLLLDMYGSGCLQNLAALAGESDLTRDLVQTNLYEPFLSSVQRYPCGLSVNVAPYRAQPQCFWREALKQLMHSMNMPMVRDSAVGNFVERMQRPGVKLLAGWLELRKGVHSYLYESGELVIMKEGVLRKQLGSVTSSTTTNQKRQQLLSQVNKVSATTAVSAVCSDVTRLTTALCSAYNSVVSVYVDVWSGRCSVDGVKLDLLNKNEFGVSGSGDSSTNTDNVSVSSSSGGNVLIVGPWHIEVQVLRDTNTASTNNNTTANTTSSTTTNSTTTTAVGGCRALSTLSAALPGTFTYDIPLLLPQYTTGGVSNDYTVTNNTGDSTHTDTTTTVNSNTTVTHTTPTHTSITTSASTGAVQLSLFFQLEQVRCLSEELALHTDLHTQLQRSLNIGCGGSVSGSSGGVSGDSTTDTTSTHTTVPSAAEVRALCVSGVVVPADLLLVDARLRQGLPLFVVSSSGDGSSSGGGSSESVVAGCTGDGGVVLRFVYTYHSSGLEH